MPRPAARTRRFWMNTLVQHGAMALCALLAVLAIPCAIPSAYAAAAPASWQAYARNFYFHHLDSSNGLAQNSVTLVFQDAQGFIWLATQGGLFRYDGYTLKRYIHDPNRADSLPEDYRFTALADAGQNRLWVGSATSGLRLFDYTDNKVTHLPASIERPSLPVSSLLALPDGSVLVGSTLGLDRLTGGGAHPALTPVWRESPGRNDWVRALAHCPDGGLYASVGDQLIAIDATFHARVLASADAPIVGLACSSKNRLSLATGKGLFDVERAQGTLTPKWHPANAGVGVSALAIDPTARIWLALSDHSLVALGPDPQVTRVAPAPLGVSGGLPNSPITTLFIGRSGLLWVGTLTEGVAWTTPQESPIQSVLNLSGDPRSNTFVRAFLPAADGGWWVALNGPGFAHYDPTSHTVTSYHAALEEAIARAGAPVPAPSVAGSRTVPAFVTLATAPNPRIFSIVDGDDGSLLLPSSRGIFRFDPAKGSAKFLELDGRPATEPTHALLRARNGDLWIAPFNDGVLHYHAGREVQHFTTANGLASDMAVTFIEDAQGRIWVGTTRGVSMIDPASGKVRSFRESPEHKDSLAGDVVVSFLQTRAGALWIGTLSGLNRLDSVDAGGAHFKRYTMANGLPDPSIDCLLEDARGGIWFSTNLGLGRLDPATGDIRTYSTSNGLQGDEYNSNACYATQSGLLMFAGHGIDIINPQALARAQRPHAVVITDLYTGRGPAPIPAPGDTLRIGSHDRALYVAFTALDYAAPGTVRYRARLLGKRDSWSTPTAQYATTYSDLAPGDYQLQIQAVAPDGGAGPITSLPVHVAQLWWWTWPMRVLYAAIIALLVLIAALAWVRRQAEQRRNRRQLQLRDSRLRHALWGSGDQFWDWDLERGSGLRLGPEGGPGGHREEAFQIDAWRRTMVHPDDRVAFDTALAEHLAGRREHFEVEHRVRGRDGEWIWVIARGKVVERDNAGKPLRICGTERDISAIRAADRDRRIATEVIRNMSEAVIVTDLDFRFLSVNAAFTRMTGYTEAEVLGRDASLLDSSSHDTGARTTSMREVLTEASHWRGETWQRRKDGEEFLCWIEWNEVCDAKGQRTHLIGVLSDITERKRAEQELRYLANYDTLTGLPNRALLAERLGAAVLAARRTGHKVGLLFLDLDRFKHINDSLGHVAGDRTLKAAGARLRQCVREVDVVARLGGDEFTVVLEDLADARAAEDMAQRVIQGFAKPLSLGAHQETVISPSIGIALFPDHGQTPADLLKCADTAMYQAKERGRNTWAVYHSGMDARSRGHATMITALRRALDHNELHLVYQPKMSLADNRITGMEALLRWRNPTLGDIPPSVFIPLAEDTGLIHQISAFVFATACADLRRFRDGGYRHLRMAINLSAAQLNRPDLTLHICDMLAEQDVAPDQVELELTETMVMSNPEQSLRVLSELKSIGVSLAIDDFGTGYSSLAYLKRLPIDTLKIDQSFVGDITVDRNDAAITSTIIAMAHVLEVNVVAEGVETVEQLDFLRAQRCDEIQGFWLSRPISADTCLGFLDRRALATPTT